jgi:hypothetical protein
MTDTNAVAHARIQSEYAGFSAQADAANEIKQTTDSLHLRAPTAPVEVKKPHAPAPSVPPLKLEVIQTALFTILIAVVEMALLPSAYVQGLVFLTLCVGVGVGIYLATK